MTSAPPAVRIVVADDHHVVRTGFAALLDTQPDFAVVGTAHDGTEAVRICRELSPDVVLMDVRMPVMDGIEATRQLTGSGPDGSPGPRILILTTFDLDSYVYDALCAGASGFLLKDVTAERLFEAVRVIAAGEALLAPAVTRRLISEFTRLRPRPEAPAAGVLATLTPRETQVLRLVAEGLSNPEVAARLVVTEETVKTHVSRILAKLGLRDRTQAVVTAYELGLVVPGSRDPGRSPGLSDAYHEGPVAAPAAHPWGVAPPPTPIGASTAKDSVAPLSTSVSPPPRAMVWFWPACIAPAIWLERVIGSTSPAKTYPTCPADGPVAVGT